MGYDGAMYPTRRFKLFEYHGHMLSDRIRVNAYAEALQRAVRPGMRVLDVGTGTGLLACLAARAGAGRVDAIEVGEIIDVARRVVAHNQLEDRVKLHAGLSYHAHLPHRAELLVTETLGNFGLEEGILATVLDARFRLLEPGAPILPSAVELFVRPLEHPAEAAKLEALTTEVAGVRYDCLAGEPQRQLWYTRFSEAEALGPRQSLGRVDLRTHDSPDFAGRAELLITRDGLMHGVGGTFRAELGPELEVHNEPVGGAPHWRQAFFPLDEAWPLKAGERLAVHIASHEGGSVWSWSVRSRDRGFEASTS